MSDLEFNHICTYHLINEDENDEEEIGIKDMLYKIQLLQMFKWDEDDDIIINNKINLLFQEVKEEQFLKDIFKIHPYNINNDTDFLFHTLFSYDYFYIFHKLLYLYFNKLDFNKQIEEITNKFLSK